MLAALAPRRAADGERLGAQGFGHDHGQPFLGREFSSEPDYSAEIAREIDDEIRRIVGEAHQTARQVLEDHRDQLELVSDILLRRETIEREQFIELLDGRTETEVFGAEEPHVPVPPPAAPASPSPRARARADPEAAAAARPRGRRGVRVELGGPAAALRPWARCDGEAGASIWLSGPMVGGC